MSAFDYSSLEEPDFVYGNGSNLIASLKAALLQEATDPVNSNFALRNHSGLQTINAQYSFANGVECPNSPTNDNNLCKRRWVRNNFVDLTTNSQEITANKDFHKIYISEFLNINENSELRLVGNITANNTTITANEISRINGLSSNAQTQLDNRVTLSGSQTITGDKTMTGDVSFTSASRPTISNSTVTVDGNILTRGDLKGYIGNNGTTPLAHINGITSDIQAQVNSKQATIGASTDLSFRDLTCSGTVTLPTKIQGDNSTNAATTAYVDTAVSNLVAAAPAALNTLNELAAALGSDANFSTTMTNALAGKQATITSTSDLSFRNLEAVGTVALPAGSITDSMLATTTFIKDGSTPTLTATNISGLPQSGVINLTTDLAAKQATITSTSDLSFRNLEAVGTISLPAGSITDSMLATTTFVKSSTAPTLTATNISGLPQSGVINLTTDLAAKQATITSTSDLSFRNLEAVGTVALPAGSITDSMLATTTFVKSGDSPTLTGTNITNIPQSGVTNLTTDLASKQSNITLTTDLSFRNLTCSGTVNLPTKTQGDNSTNAATTAYVDVAISNLVATAPSTLNTLNELATALGNDSNFSTTITNALAGKQATITSTTDLSFRNLEAIGTVALPDGSITDGMLATTTFVKSGDSPTLTGTNITNIPQSGVTNLTTDLAAKQATIGATSDLSFRDLTCSGTVTLPTGSITDGMLATTTFVKSGDSPTLTGTNITNIPQSGVTNLTTDLASKQASIGATTDLSFRDLTCSGTVTLPTKTQGDNSTNAATTAYVDVAISNLVATAPSTLNTLNELATALGNDSNFSTTMTNALAAKASDSDTVHKTGNETIAGVKTFSSAPVMSGSSISSGTIPTASLASGDISCAALTASGLITASGNITVPSAATLTMASGSTLSLQNSSIATSKIASGDLTVTGLTCSSITNSGNLFTTSMCEKLAACTTNSTNNYTCNYSTIGVSFLSTAPTANFTLNLHNSVSNSTKTCPFTLIYANTNETYPSTINVYSDAGSTAITCSVIWAGGSAPSITNATVSVFTGCVVQCLSSNYILCNVASYA